MNNNIEILKKQKESLSIWLSRQASTIEKQSLVLQREEQSGRLLQRLCLPKPLTRFLAGTLATVMLFSLAGCKQKTDSIDGEKDNFGISYERILNTASNYKESAFIRDYQLYSDTNPEFYFGDYGCTQSEAVPASGVLTDDFENLFNYICATNWYYKGIIEMYDKGYKVDSDGNLIFDWDKIDSRAIDFDSTIFSCKIDGENKSFKFEDKKGEKTVVSRTILDEGNKLTNSISFQKILSQDIHVDIKGSIVREDIGVLFDLSPEEKLLKSSNLMTLTVFYHGKSYEFHRLLSKTNVNSSNYEYRSNTYIWFPEMESYSNDDEDVKKFYELLRLILDDDNYVNGVNEAAVKFLDNYTTKEECLALLAEGKESNPWYEYVKQLIDNGNYSTALEVMQDENTHWKSKIKIFTN